MARLENKVALITGGTSGIGAETARLFIEEGAQVIISGRSEEKGSKLAKELGENASYCLSDVTKEEDIKNAISYTTDSLGTLDILFNNAGGPVGAGLENVTRIEDSLKLLASSVTSLDGLAALTSVGANVEMRNNADLASCHIDAFVERVGAGNVGGEVKLENNNDELTCD